ncbi:MAG: ABC transporter ATP-binding protein [bacterium]|nr:ABC transporter ATP-binding protein [bacterium]
MDAPALRVEQLVKTYRRGVRAVDGLSFEVPRGSIFGLLGPNGAGKTTTLKILNTLIPPTSGRASVLGFDVVAQGLEVRRRISVVIQESAAEMFLSVHDNLLTYARFHGVDARLAKARAADLLERFQLAAEAERKAMDLSGGQRRRVQVAKVFLVETPVIFMDEFSTGMDPILKRAVMEMLRGEAARGRTIVLTTQILSEAEELCDDILIMNHGRQVARGDLHALKLLSSGMKEVAITFERVPPGLEAELRALAPLHLRITDTTVELGVRMPEAEILALVSRLAARGNVLHLEMGGASLEDVFVELMAK